jgi:tRNA G18 (ribose-2'-O)-methylase SpoU
MFANDASVSIRKGRQASLYAMSSPPSRDAQRVMEDVRRVLTAKGRHTVGAFAAEGRRIVERGLRAGCRPRAVLVGEGVVDAGDAEAGALMARISELGSPCHLAPDAALLKLSEGRKSGLITALFELPEPSPIESLLARRPAPAVFLVLVDVEEPGNVGALIRTALACDAVAVIGVGRTDPYHPKAVRTSLGSLFKMPFSRLEAGADPVAALRRAGLFSLAAVARAGEPLDRALWPKAKLALLVGNEGQGLSESVRLGADCRISIDLSTEADSFCVNAAAAVCLYEIQRRQRGS